MNAFEKILSEIDKGIKTIEPLMKGETRQIAESQIIGLEEARKIVEKYKGNTRWIPCSEQMPDEGGTYIVNAIENHIVHVTFAKWMPRMKRWNLTGSRSYWKVTAWQPLPDPYKEECD